jgi:hypothetical protein
VGRLSGAVGKAVASIAAMKPTPAPRPSDENAPANEETGISNRATAREEQADRREHPPLDPGPPPPEDAAGNVGDAQTATFDGGQTSHKAGSRSVAQKEDEARYPDRSMPPSRKAAGAFGKEPQG